MANVIKSVVAEVNGEKLNLTYNSSTGLYEASGVAPSASSFFMDGGYYPVSVTATYMTDVSTTVNDKTGGSIGTGCRFVVKERFAPTINIVFPTAGQYVTSTQAQRVELELRDNTKQTEGYSGIDLSTFTLRLGEVVADVDSFNVTEVEGGYNLSYVPEVPLKDGSYTIYASVSDNDGNASEITSTSFIIDTAPPELSITYPNENLATSESTLTVTGVTSDATGLGVTITLNLDGHESGTAYVNPDGSFMHEINLSEEGEHILVVTATDSSGKSSSITRTFFFSTAIPNITSVELIPNPVDGGATFTIKVAVS